MRCRGVQWDANAAHLEGFPFPALLRVAPYCVPGGIRLVSGARSLRNSPTRKKASAACLFLSLQGIGYGPLESHRAALAPRLLPFFLSHACAHSRNLSVSLREEGGIKSTILRPNGRAVSAVSTPIINSRSLIARRRFDSTKPTELAYFPLLTSVETAA